MELGVARPRSKGGEATLICASSLPGKLNKALCGAILDRMNQWGNYRLALARVH